jgi:DNA-binding response OmpR family regulator
VSKIIIVEDNKDLSNIYKSELEYNGFEITTVGTSMEMFSVIDEVKPNLVLLDIMLPDSSGIDTLKRIKSDKKYSNIKIIIVSNIDAPAVINEAFAAGADGYLIKSIILPTQLTDEVKSFLT